MWSRAARNGTASAKYVLQYTELGVFGCILLSCSVSRGTISGRLEVLLINQGLL